MCKMNWIQKTTALPPKLCAPRYPLQRMEPSERNAPSIALALARVFSTVRHSDYAHDGDTGLQTRPKAFCRAHITSRQPRTTLFRTSLLGRPNGCGLPTLYRHTTGLNDLGLPIGVQIVGPQYGDLITIGVAQKLEGMGFFEAPAAYR